MSGLDVGRPNCTVGVDLAAEPARTAVATVRWGSRPELVALDYPASDDQIVAAGTDAERIGIDCPLGWPQAFVEFVRAHAEGRPVAAAGTISDRRRLAYRATDLHCRDVHGLAPLSVAADRIGHAALRCAALVPRVSAGRDRSGTGRLVEVYPAGALRQWGLPYRRYKTDPSTLEASVRRVSSDVGIRFRTPELREACTVVDHAFDALVSALVARAAQLGRVEPIPEPLRAAAAVEGWITLPTGSLADLA